MTVRTRVEPIDRDIEILISDTLSPEAQSRAIAAYAREALEETQATNRAALGREPAYETFVDGSRGAALEAVRPDGTIVFAFEVVTDLLAWIGEQLVLHSPVRSGRYARSHAFFADGVEQEPGPDTPAAEEYVFVNTVPYARKIERGLSPQAPDGVYEGVATLARRRFGNAASIKFSYREPMTGGVMAWAAGRRGNDTSPKARRQFQADIRQPAIVVRLR